MDKLKLYETLKKDYSGYDNKYKTFIDLLNNSIPFSYNRFNDGEMSGIDKIGSIAARGDQTITKELHLKLIEAIKHKQDNYYIGIPCDICYPKYNKLAKDLIGSYQYITSAVCLTNRNWGKFITEIPTALKKPIIWISGEDQNLDFLKNNMGIEIKNHYKFKNKNTWEEYNNIFDLHKNFNEGDIVFISLGPTARILVYEWFKLLPKTSFIDIGSIFDPFTRDVYHKCHLGWENGFNLVRKCLTCN